MFLMKDEIGGKIMNALIVLADGFEDVEAVTVVDILRRAEVSVTVAGVTSGVVTGARGVRVTPDVVLADGPLFDVIVLPGGARGAEALAASSLVNKRIRDHHAAGRWVAAICAAPAVVLAPLGILDGRRATCFPGMEASFPSSVSARTEPVVVDGNIITSRALGTSLSFALEIVARLVGAPTADKIRAAVLAS
jgi:4-methyl-5(b-hydroxyethyl)-thiazole monophosphate biosynthesis